MTAPLLFIILFGALEMGARQHGLGCSGGRRI